MPVTPIGALFAALAAAAVFASLRGGYAMGAAVLGAAIPLSASAAAVFGFAGGASLLVATLAAAGFVAAAGWDCLLLRKTSIQHALFPFADTRKALLEELRWERAAPTSRCGHGAAARRTQSVWRQTPAVLRAAPQSRPHVCL